MSGIKITAVKIVGNCSKHRKQGDEIPKDISGRIYNDSELFCIPCDFEEPEINKIDQEEE